MITFYCYHSQTFHQKLSNIFSEILQINTLLTLNSTEYFVIEEFVLCVTVIYCCK